MYNTHEELNEFYENCVRLKNERRTLVEHRDANIDRLKTGLTKLGCPNSFVPKDQGSFPMNTINKHPEKKYDIDEAIIFAKDNLPSNPAEARKRIEAAMVAGGGNFRQPPKALTNAVRVYYVEGHHVDLAVYRKNIDMFGNPIIEHAGIEWTKRNPVAITDWFNSAVPDKSPSKDSGASVEDGQLRRIVRWLKVFARSRSDWNMPCGLIISVLAVECYVPNQYRDDSSLYDTMQSILNRLRSNKEVENPVDLSQTLTGREKDKTRMENLENNLESALNELSILFKANCSHPQALNSWNWVFNHSFWTDASKTSSNDENAKKSGTVVITHPPKQHLNG
jgi:hypothetical protein